MNLDLFDAGQEEEGGAETPPLSVQEEGGGPPESRPEAPPTRAGPEEPIEAPTVWTVSQVNQAVRVLLEDTLPPLWVAGEVANWTRARSGHCYFTLKDESAQLRSVLWKTDASRLPMDLEEGMRVRVFGQLTLYEARGDYQMVARQVEGEEGDGLWKLAFERLRRRLQEEGLLAPERKRRLPRFPRTVGVVTSLTGAALHDILTVLRRRAPWLRVLVRGARVQGEGASREIAEALRVLGGSGEVDVVIVGRGGGSVEDLWAFNEEPVARAVAECPVPVISAVGHEVDLTISDLVADWRAPTPSAAAEAVAPDKEELLRYLEGAATRLARGLRRVVDRPRRSLQVARDRLRGAVRRVALQDRRALEQARGRLVRLGARVTDEPRRAVREGNRGLERGIRTILESRRSRLARLAGTLDALSPLATLRRGYAVPMDEGGGVLRSVEDFAPGGEFELRIVDGRVRSVVRDTRKDEVQGD